jgi:prolyl 4-hydroxylase
MDTDAHDHVVECDGALFHSLISNRKAIVKTIITPPEKALYKPRMAFTLDNVLSREECRKLIATTEQVGYRPALVSTDFGMVYDSSYRFSDRCMIDSPPCADEIYKRIKPFLPAKFNGTCKCLGLNERLRFLRYRPGNRFLPHRDGGFFKRDKNGNIVEESLFSILLFLNDVDVKNGSGGSTRFLDPEDPEISFVNIVPTAGSALVFEHRAFHQGTRVEAGEKYCVRSCTRLDFAM